MWLPIPGYEDYDVSDEGQVRSRKRGTPRLLRLQAAGDRRRYRKVSLPVDQKYVHHLVAEAFIGPRPDGMEVRHLDGDPTNNCLDNLAYGTSAENSADCIAHGNTNRGTRMWKSKLTERHVRIMRGLKRCGFKQSRIAEIFGCKPQLVSDVIRKKSWAWVT